VLSIGWRNLKRDRLRLCVAVLGVIFAVVLVTVELGMLLGLVRNASMLIDDSRADLWVSTVDVKTFDFANPVEQRKRYLIEGVAGVERVEEFNASFSSWKLPSGGNMNVQVIGFDVRGQLAPPLELSAGRIEDLHNRDAVIVDESELSKLGHPKIGDLVEIIGQRAEVVGYTRGMRSFTTAPFIFTSLRRGEQYGYLTSIGWQSRRPAVYFLVKVGAGYDVETVRRSIEAHVSNVEAHTRAGFSMRTRKYWLLETGVGLGFLGASILGLLVGGVILSQSLYAMTLEKLPEYGVLRAIGASMRDLGRVVVEQALICGVLGLAIGIVISAGLQAAANSAGTAVLLPWQLVGAVAFVTTVMCMLAALASIHRLRRLEPAMVFRT